MSVSSEEASASTSASALSADVGDSESSISFSCGRFRAEAASTSAASSPLGRPILTANSAFPPPFMFPVICGKDAVLLEEMPQKPDTNLSEVEMMKERFAKLLLGEDMSGGGKGVCTALAISNAITNLSATVFGELWRLEPLALQKKAMWCREMECLLCVSNSIVELVPSLQQSTGGGTYEVMATRPRSDLYINLPALKKLDAMLISILDGFHDLDFWYVDRGILLADGDDRDAYPSTVYGGRPSVRQEEKWWLPCPKVPPKGLSEDARKRLQQCRDCTNQILKAALAINCNELAEMETPSAYSDTLPKNGKACLGDIVYRYITADQFLPELLLDCLDLSSEHHTLEVANRVEAAVHVWKLKDSKKHTKHSKAKHSSWSGKVKGLVADGEKNHFLAQRAESLLHSLRLRFPGLPQTALDMNKIQYNKDVGQSILESYSRVMESLAFNIMARIDDVLYADDAAKRCAAAESVPFFSSGGLAGLPIQKRISPSPFSIQLTPYTSPFASNGELSASSRPFFLPTKTSWNEMSGKHDLADDGYAGETRTANPVDHAICSFAAAGNCPRGYKCPHLHGDLCPTCGKHCLHPFRPEEREEHIKTCEKKQNHLEALKRSQEIECSVCLERVLSKPTEAERKFGLLSECDHPFCVSCIRNWRSSSPTGMDVNSALRTCPICRKLSYFVIPSVIWYSTKEEKQEIVDSYKTKLRGIDCKHFDFGNGSCPFGTSCFYKHAYRDGRLEEVVLRHLGAEDGNTVIAKDIRLSDFLNRLHLR